MRIEPIHINMAGVEIRPNICTAVGDQIPPHRHDFEHMATVTLGRWRVSIGDREHELASPSLNKGGELQHRIIVPGGAWHAMEVLELENGAACVECWWAGGVK